MKYVIVGISLGAYWYQDVLLLFSDDGVAATTTLGLVYRLQHRKVAVIERVLDWEVFESDPTPSGSSGAPSIATQRPGGVFFSSIAPTLT
jgi:hypothetical protein